MAHTRADIEDVKQQIAAISLQITAVGNKTKGVLAGLVAAIDRWNAETDNVNRAMRMVMGSDEAPLNLVDEKPAPTLQSIRERGAKLAVGNGGS